jgi:hypothetical protein
LCIISTSKVCFFLVFLILGKPSALLYPTFPLSQIHVFSIHFTCTYNTLVKMFSILKNAFLLLLLLMGVLVNGYGAPGACSGACWSHDPAVIQRSSDGVYFRFSTGSGIQITKATSLSGPWTIQGYALPSGSSIDLSGNTDLWVSWFSPPNIRTKG